MPQDVENPTLRLNAPITDLPGIQDRRADLFARLGIRTVGHLIRHYPSRYVEVWPEGNIEDLPMDAIGSTRGTVTKTRSIPGRGRGGRGGRGGGRFEVDLEDHTGQLRLTWFNATYLRRKLHAGMVLRVQGTTKAYNGDPQMVNPQWEVIDEDGSTPVTSEVKLRPIYPATEDLSSGIIEIAVKTALSLTLPTMEDLLPDDLLTEHGFLGLADAFGGIHQPDDKDHQRAARRRLAFNELLLLQLGIAIKRHYNQATQSATELGWSQPIDQHIRERFPFDLTGAQERVIKDIITDLQKKNPMNRLIQGDVGSGKTVVALYALLMAVVNRHQAALMAPTELLAEQHYLSISSLLEGGAVRIALLTAGQAASGSSQRAVLNHAIANGEYDIVIGTQALLSESVRFKNLAVVVIDEQHRFGVLQRAELKNADEKAPNPKAPDKLQEQQDNLYSEIKPKEADPQENRDPIKPHYLIMTATPIPRTLSLTVFGDLDVSTIDELPPGRSPIKTRVIGSDKSDDAYAFLAKRLAAGEQAYVVVPAIDADGQETETQLKSVNTHASWLAETHCAGHQVAAIHGRLKRKTREGIMARFRRGAVQVLVATTVIEVGVDVPNATVMIVEHAERFGLSQLHQLRGRVGRGTHTKGSVCVFISDPTTPDAEQRMAAIAKTCDGFKIAEHDLQIRGIGEFFGTRQHGAPPLKLARIPDDMDLLQIARRDAINIVANDPKLTDASNRMIRKVLLKKYGDAVALIDVG